MAQASQFCHHETCLALDELHGADGTQEEDGRNHQGMDCQPPPLIGWVLCCHDLPFGVDRFHRHCLNRIQICQKSVQEVYRIDGGHVALRYMARKN